MTILFFIAAIVAIGSGMMMITQKEPVHSALFLVLTFCSLSLTYFLLGAPFIGVLEIVVYAGAIMVLFLFVIMLLAAERRESTEEDPLPGVRRFGYVFAILFVMMMIYVVRTSPVRGEHGPLPMDQIIANNTQEIGMQLFTRYLLPFELTSILLLVAMIGAIVIAKRRIEG